MKNILLLSDYKSFDSPEDIYLLSNKAFFKNINLKNQQIKYKTINNFSQNYQSRYDEEIRTNKIILNIEKDLYKSLNYYHSTNFSHRYWKIILGHWVARFIKTVFFRHKILHKWLNGDHKIDLIHIAKFDSYTQSVDQTNVSWLASIDSEWNFNLFSKIIIKFFNEKCDLNYINTKKFQFTPNMSKAIDTKKKEFIKNGSLKILSLMNYFSQNNTIAFKTTYLKFYDEIKLSLFNKELPSTLFSLDYKREEIDLVKRKNLDLKNKEVDNFENLIRDLIVDALPKVAVEDYRNILNVINDSKWPLNPKIIFTSNSYDGDDFFKIWAAEKIEHKKSKYIIGQHGLFDCSEVLLDNTNDYQVCDHYLRWGEKKYDKDIALFNFKLANRHIKLKKKKITIFARTVGHECETYSRIEEFKIYNDSLNKILTSFNSDNLKETTVRLKHTFRWTNPKEFDYLREKFSLLQIDEGIKNVFSLLEKSKLAIFLYYSTGAIESLSLNIPTAFYCPKKLVYIDPQEKKYLDVLNKCRILSYEEDEFKENINFILKDIDKWWSLKDVNQARNEVINRYSRVEKNKPIIKISKLLKSLL